jgi:hypothetical protein
VGGWKESFLMTKANLVVYKLRRFLKFLHLASRVHAKGHFASWNFPPVFRSPQMSKCSFGDVAFNRRRDERMRRRRCNECLDRVDDASTAVLRFHDRTIRIAD